MPEEKSPEATRLKRALEDIRTKFPAVQKVVWEAWERTLEIIFDVVITTEEQRIDLLNDPELVRLENTVANVCRKYYLPSFEYVDGVITYPKYKGL